MAIATSVTTTVLNDHNRSSHPTTFRVVPA
jgi:hypothetical protein